MYQAYWHGALYGEGDTPQDAIDVAECDFRDNVYGQWDIDKTAAEFLAELVIEKIGE